MGAGLRVTLPAARFSTLKVFEGNPPGRALSAFLIATCEAKDAVESALVVTLAALQPFQDVSIVPGCDLHLSGLIEAREWYRANEILDGPFRDITRIDLGVRQGCQRYCLTREGSGQ